MSDSHSTIMDAIDLKIEVNKDKARELAKQLRGLTQETHEKENRKKAISSLQLM